MSNVNHKRTIESFLPSIQERKAMARTIQEAADDLAFLMGQMHGEDFCALVSHEPSFIIIRYSNMGDKA